MRADEAPRPDAMVGPSTSWPREGSSVEDDEFEPCPCPSGAGVLLSPGRLIATSDVRMSKTRVFEPFQCSGVGVRLGGSAPYGYARGTRVRGRRRETPIISCASARMPCSGRRGREVMPGASARGSTRCRIREAPMSGSRSVDATARRRSLDRSLTSRRARSAPAPALIRPVLGGRAIAPERSRRRCAPHVVNPPTTRESMSRSVMTWGVGGSRPHREGQRFPEQSEVTCQRRRDTRQLAAAGSRISTTIEGSSSPPRHRRASHASLHGRAHRRSGRDKTVDRRVFQGLEDATLSGFSADRPPSCARLNTAQLRSAATDTANALPSAEDESPSPRSRLTPVASAAAAIDPVPATRPRPTLGRARRDDRGRVVDDTMPPRPGRLGRPGLQPFFVCGTVEPVQASTRLRPGDFPGAS